METKNIKRFLEQIAKEIVAGAKKNLTADKGSTKLEGTIRAEVVSDDKGFTTKFYMDNYGAYLDEGVSGNKKPQNFKDYKGTTRISSHKYTTKGPPIDILSKWIKKKGIEPKGLGRGRSKKSGQYISGFAYLISRKIKRDGIKSLSFFQQPLGVGYEKIKEKLLKELKIDVTNYIVAYTK